LLIHNDGRIHLVAQAVSRPTYFRVTQAISRATAKLDLAVSYQPVSFGDFKYLFVFRAMATGASGFFHLSRARMTCPMRLS